VRDAQLDPDPQHAATDRALAETHRPDDRLAAPGSLQRGGGHYIVGEKLRSDSKEANAALQRQGRYHTVQGNLRVKQVRIDEGTNRDRFVICHNPERAEREGGAPDGLSAACELEAERALLAHSSGDGDDGHPCKNPYRCTRVKLAPPREPPASPQPAGAAHVNARTRSYLPAGRTSAGMQK